MKQTPQDIIDTNIATIEIQAGQFSQMISLTKEGIELAKGFLDLLGRQIKTEKKPKEKPKEED